MDPVGTSSEWGKASTAFFIVIPLLVILALALLFYGIYVSFKENERIDLFHHAGTTATSGSGYVGGGVGGGYTTYREDLLTNEEFQHLWRCVECDFENFEAKEFCALCQTMRRTHHSASSSSSSPSASYKSLKDKASDQKDQRRRIGRTFSRASTVDTDGSFLSTLSSTMISQPDQEHQQQEHNDTTNASLDQYVIHIDQDDEETQATTINSAKERHAWRREFDSIGRLKWTPNDHRASVHMDDFAFVTRVVTTSSACQLDPFGQLEISCAKGASASPRFRTRHHSTDTNFDVLDSALMESLRVMSFPEKHLWFLRQCNLLMFRNRRFDRWENDHLTPEMVLSLDRQDFFEDSVTQITKATQRLLHQRLRIHFKKEPGVDAGGLVREWLCIMFEQFFDPEKKLFHLIGSTGKFYINPQAKEQTQSILPPKYLEYFFAFGRCLGKALLEGHLVNVPLISPLFKQILGIPIVFQDLVHLDPQLYQSLQTLEKLEHVENLELDFTMIDGKGGGDEYRLLTKTKVTDENKMDFVESFFKWKMVETISDEIAALISGVYDVIPYSLLSIFDHQELEILLCGDISQKQIDLNDWQVHTKIERTISKRKAIQLTKWFWEIVSTFSIKEQYHLLQFATGTSRIPLQGFKALTTSDDKLGLFTLNWLEKKDCLFIRAITCFNRLDIPAFNCKEKLEQALKWIVEMEKATGFSIQ